MEGAKGSTAKTIVASILIIDNKDPSHDQLECVFKIKSNFFGVFISVASLELKPHAL
jgi:hypothetical protein